MNRGGEPTSVLWSKSTGRVTGKGNQYTISKNRAQELKVWTDFPQQFQIVLYKILVTVKTCSLWQKIDSCNCLEVTFLLFHWSEGVAVSWENRFA